jgi:hypothetical protein
MGLVLGKSKALVPKGVKVIKHMGSAEQAAIRLTTEIAKSFGLQSKKMKPKKIIFR